MIALRSALCVTAAVVSAGAQPSFSSVRDDARTDPTLIPRDRDTLTLLDHLGAGDHPLKRSQAFLANALGCSVRTVQRSLKRLTDAGYLIRTARYWLLAGRVRRGVDHLFLVGRRHKRNRPKPPETTPVEPDSTYTTPMAPEGLREELEADSPQDRSDINPAPAEVAAFLATWRTTKRTKDSPTKDRRWRKRR